MEKYVHCRLICAKNEIEPYHPLGYVVLFITFHECGLGVLLH